MDSSENLSTDVRPAAQTLNARTVPRLGVDRSGRPERIMHALDGLLEPADATSVGEISAQLWTACRTLLEVAEAEPDFILGLEAGGIVPAVGLAIASGLPYKIAYKLRLALPGTIQFIEPHSARREMYAYGIESGQRILIVDDEITTGRTIANLVRILRQAGAEPLGAACLIEDTSCGGRERLSELGMSLASLTTLPCLG